jgi:hypothetical protein
VSYEKTSMMETDDWQVIFTEKLTKEEWDAIGERSSDCFDEEGFKFDIEKSVAVVKEVHPGIEVKSVLKYMSPKEFQEQGYLQEVNRQFLHPLGLALSVNPAKGRGRGVFGPIWDCRDDPEGIYFEGTDLSEKAKMVRKEVAKRTGPRVKALGYWMQRAISETLQNDEEEDTIEP